jgi:hypothetical protein
VLNASFNALGTERYLLTEDNRSMRDVAAAVPYDAIVILVNSDRYGGGGIYNDYAISTVNNQWSENVFLHEFGHSFAGLADEYYSSEVAYNEFFPRGVEPVPPNITAYLEPEELKWKQWLSPGIGIPTHYGKKEAESLQQEVRNIMEGLQRTENTVEKQKADTVQAKALREQTTQKLDSLREKIRSIQEKYRKQLKGKVGLFEGAGYSSEGLYRSEIECIMLSNREKRFCKVCREAIIRMIGYYTR